MTAKKKILKRVQDDGLKGEIASSLTLLAMTKRTGFPPPRE
jgi:hypothetical protein